LEPSIVQATSFHQQLPLWMCLPLTHPSSLFSLRRDFSPPPDFRTVRNCPEPLSMRRRTAFLRQGCRILYIVGVCVNRIGTLASIGTLLVALVFFKVISVAPPERHTDTFPVSQNTPAFLAE